MKVRGSSVLVAALVLAVLAGSILLVTMLGTGTHQTSTGKSESFLIVANANGFNDSIDHGVPQNSWPIIQVTNGTLVTISVVNQDHQAHGFQITHYYDSTIVTVSPGQTITVSFVADQKGTFRIYCSIFCTVHGFMQSGELVVT